MLRIFSLLVALSLMFTSVNGQLQSPEQFLGYPVGSRYTPHWKIINYFNHVAANSNIKIQQYGETNEGRPLIVAMISSPGNMNNLESIRMNNLRLANISKDRAAPIEENSPAIVWLSYNVHGNEPSSSEASMVTLYALINPNDKSNKEWLNNTVVIIDPCLNPDGRERYVNWYTSTAGKNPNAEVSSREHDEPWPGGRTNHYNFDLNRDWAWQVQVESQQRIKLYNQWMPQIHVDYHEQDINSPYYFAPAAASYNDVITSWQRDFQVTIGKNHAGYFDRSNWLFFTKEIFDLFYPSYGDTYPMFNGAIGMTYEQAGGPAGGLVAIKNEGDTLSLTDRVMHHYTTGLSTIEITSKNASRIIKEFRKYFNDAVNTGAGPFKSYIIKNNASNSQRILPLLQLFDRNGINYGTASPGSSKGYRYTSGKEESLSITSEDIVISGLQPKAALVKALMEPESRLEDSVTYDITAWALPFVYGMETYGLKDNWRTAGAYTSPVVSVPVATPYGYVIRWEGLQTVKLLSSLLQKGIIIRYAEEPFDMNGKTYDRGSLIILKNGNQSTGNTLWKIIEEVCKKEQVNADAIFSGFADKGYDLGSSRIHSLKAPKIVMLTGKGIDPSAAGEVWHFFDQQISYPLTLVNAEDMVAVNWKATDVLILPDGNTYGFLEDKTMVEKLKDWVSGGGRVIAMRRAVEELGKAGFGIKRKPKDSGTANDSLYAPLRKFSNRQREAVSSEVPGAIIKVNLDNTHPLAFGYPDFLYTLKLDARVYEFIKENGWNVGYLKKQNKITGYVGSQRKGEFQDGLLFGVQEMGRGTITYLGGELLYRGFWENGKLMFSNAVFLVGQ